MAFRPRKKAKPRKAKPRKASAKRGQWLTYDSEGLVPATPTRALVDAKNVMMEVLSRFQRQMPITKDLLDQLPPDLTSDLEVEVTDDRGKVTPGVLRFEKGAVTFHPLDATGPQAKTKH